MGSLDLKRKQIRGLFAKVLNEADEFTCITSVSKRFSSDELPLVLVRSVQSQEELLGGPPIYYRCKTLFVVSIVASDNASVEDTVDDLSGAAHSRIILGLTKEADIQSIKRVKTETEFKEGGSSLSGKVDIFYEVTYLVKEKERENNGKKYLGTKFEDGENL